MANIQEYLDTKRELNNIIFDFLDDSDGNSVDIKSVINLITQQKIPECREELQHFLLSIIQISNHYQRFSNFFDKIKEIFNYLIPIIKQTFSNYELFNLTKSNKLILLYFIENQTITIDTSISSELSSQTDYFHFFYPELKSIADPNEVKKIEAELQANNYLDNFDQIRHKGENDSIICSLIREDSVIDFITYINKKCINLNGRIKPSIFETNSFLLKREPTLIEYAAFYGSIQIFQYLKNNHAELTSSLWLYVIHSKNAELIHILESNGVSFPEECFLEAIKCHHNEIAAYIKDNILQNVKNELLIKTAFHYHNYLYFPVEFKKDYEFFYLNYYHYSTLVKFYIENREKEINENIVYSAIYTKYFLFQYHSSY